MCSNCSRRPREQSVPPWAAVGHWSSRWRARRWWTAAARAAESVAGAALDCPEICRGVTLGTCHPGLEGFRLTHLEAVAALQMNDAMDSAVVRFEDVEIACLAAGILADDARAHSSGGSWVPVAETDETTRRLRDTLRVYLKQGSDAAAAGPPAPASQHRPLSRSGGPKGIGHPILQRRVHVELALEIVSVLGIAP